MSKEDRHRPFYHEAKTVVENLVGRPLIDPKWAVKKDIETIREALERAYLLGLKNRK